MIKLNLAMENKRMQNNPLFLQFMEDSLIRTLTLGVSYLVGAGVDGDLAEFGTMSGSTAMVLARAMEEVQRVWGAQDEKLKIAARKLHLFDSFEGLPAAQAGPDKSSPFVQSEIWAPGVCKGLSAKELARAVEQFLKPERYEIYAGWFADTLQQIPVQTRFALVHLDCDLYASTYEVLDHLMAQSQLSEGALLFFDDWNCQRASPELGQRKAWGDILERYPGIAYSEAGSYGIFGNKLIFHGRSR